MQVGNKYKLAIALASMTIGFVFILILLLGGGNDEDHATVLALGTSLITMPVGYIIGNGVAAKSGITADPIIHPKRKVNENDKG